MKRATPLLLLLATAWAASGCIVVDDDVYLGDLEVNWRLQGSQSATLCDTYAIDGWLVSASGPEYREVELDCRQNYWSSESDFYDLEEGLYTVAVDALDGFGNVITGQSTTADVLDDGLVEVITLRFFDTDF